MFGNYVQLTVIGRVTMPVQLKRIASSAGEVVIANFSVASNQKTKDGEKTIFINCAAFGKKAEFIQKFVSKGDLVFVQGTVAEETYQDKQGQTVTRYKLSVVEFQRLHSKVSDEAVGGLNDALAGINVAPSQGQYASPRKPVQQPLPQTQKAGGYDFDDIPF